MLLASIPLPSFPPVPQELKQKIIINTLYDGSEFSSDFQESDLTEVVQDTLQQQKVFAKTFLTVNKDIYLLASSTLAQSIFIASERELQRHLTLADAPLGHSSAVTYGQRCARLELRTADMRASSIATLLRKLPNIRVLIIRTDWRRPGLITPNLELGALISVLITCNRHLTRLQLEGEQEFITPALLKTLIVSLPLLQTLRVRRIFNDPITSAVTPLLVSSSPLRTLSLASGVPSTASDALLESTPDVLALFPTVSSLPALQSFHVSGPVAGTRRFLKAYAGKLLELGISTADEHFVSGEDGEAHLVSMAHSLKTLVIFCPQGYSPNVLDGLPSSPGIQNVVLVLIPRLRVGMWGGLVVLRHALRFSRVITQESLRGIEIVAPPKLVDAISHAPWFSQYCDDLRREGIEVEGITTYSLFDQMKGILTLSGLHLAMAQLEDSSDSEGITTTTVGSAVSWARGL